MSARLASVCACLAAALVTATCSLHEPQPIDVSVRDLVIDPYAVDGKRVRLVGRLHRSQSGDALYWHDSDIASSNHSHAVAVQLQSSWPEGAEDRGRYVVVEGTFEADGDCHGAGYNGELLEAHEAHLR